MLSSFSILHTAIDYHNKNATQCYMQQVWDVRAKCMEILELHTPLPKPYSWLYVKPLWWMVKVCAAFLLRHKPRCHFVTRFVSSNTLHVLLYSKTSLSYFPYLSVSSNEGRYA